MHRAIFQYATKLARDMVTQWGMSDELGPLQYEEQQARRSLAIRSRSG